VSFKGLRELIALIKKIKENFFVKNTFWSTLGFSLRIVVQSLYFILISRSLGATEYGAFSATIALIGIIMPFSNLGAGNLLIKNVSRNPERFRAYWGMACSAVLAGGFLSTIIVLSTFHLFVSSHITFNTVLYLCVSELIVSRFVDISVQAYQAFNKIKQSMLYLLLISFSRFFACLFVLTFIENPTAEHWSLFFFLSGLLVGVISFLSVQKNLGHAIFSFKPFKGELTEGFMFSLSYASQTIYNDIDKAMLSNYSTLDAVGIYSAAYRIIDAVSTPVKAALFSAYSGFFKRGKQGINGSLRWALKIVPWCLFYGLLVVGGIWLISGYVPLLLGPSYNATTLALRWLAMIIIFKAVHYFGSDTLTGSGHQAIRSIIQLSVALINIGLNLIFIPQYGWLGAAWVSLISDSLMMILIWGAVFVVNRMELKYEAAV
jgi:O-antigen/teichoic acid export membrane protein